MTHSIRLREPWQSLPATAPHGAAAEINSLNSLEFIRKFNSPTGLTPHQSILLELTLQAAVQSLAVHCNEQPIAPLPTTTDEAQVQSLCFDLRQHLQPFNQLRVQVKLADISHPSLSFGDLCEARLVLGAD